MFEMIDRLILRLLNLPRIIRIILVGFFSLMTVMSVFPLVDHIYIRYFFSIDTTILPSVVTVVLGGFMYAWGWWLCVGSGDPNPYARKWILWYFLIGGVATVVAIVLLVQGMLILNLPIESA